MSHQYSSASSRVFAISELVDHLISYYHLDIPSLKRYSLVCKSWDASVARYLFTALTLEANLLVTDFPLDGQVPTYEATHVRYENHPRIRDNVRALSIQYRAKLCPHLQHLIDVLNTFSSLRTLHLDSRYGFMDSPSARLSSPSPSFTKLDKLTLILYHGQFEKMPSPSLYGLFSAIEHLEVGIHDQFVSEPSLYGYLQHPLDLNATVQIRQLTLQSVNPNKGHLSLVSELLSGHVDCSRLETLSIEDCVVGRDVACVNDLLRKYGTQIKTFEVAIRPPYGNHYSSPECRMCLSLLQNNPCLYAYRIIHQISTFQPRRMCTP